MKTKIITLFLISLFFSGVLNAQNDLQELNQQETLKSIKKDARKQAKTYMKQGYYPAPGAPLIEKQLVRLAVMRKTLTDKGKEKYIISGSTSVAETQIAAKVQALESAKLHLAGQLSNRIEAIARNLVITKQISASDAVTITETCLKSVNLISQNLGRITPVVEYYRMIGQNIEVNIVIAYDSDDALEMSKEIIREDLRKRYDISEESLDAFSKSESMQ